MENITNKIFYGYSKSMLAAFHSRTNFQVMIGILPVCEQTYKISMLILPDILSLFNRFLIFVIC